jgi:uncharacterized membrane protein YdjX (TVP38/TMEM64 family)
VRRGFHYDVRVTTAAARSERSRASVLARRIAAALVVVALVTAAILARRSGIDAPTVQRELLALGWLAAPLFLLVMAAGELLHLPGMLFVVVARIVFGPAFGFALGYVGAVFAVTVSFVVARQLVAAARGVSEPWQPRWRFLQRALARLEARPVQTIAVLRLVLWLTPPLTYALASSRVRVRDHVVGSAIGLFAPVLVAVRLGGYI